MAIPHYMLPTVASEARAAPRVNDRAVVRSTAASLRAPAVGSLVRPSPSSGDRRHNGRPSIRLAGGPSVRLVSGPREAITTTTPATLSGDEQPVENALPPPGVCVPSSTNWCVDSHPTVRLVSGPQEATTTPSPVSLSGSEDPDLTQNPPPQCQVSASSENCTLCHSLFDSKDKPDYSRDWTMVSFTDFDPYTGFGMPIRHNFRKSPLPRDPSVQRVRPSTRAPSFVYLDADNGWDDDDLASDVALAINSGLGSRLSFACPTHDNPSAFVQLASNYAADNSSGFEESSFTPSLGNTHLVSLSLAASDSADFSSSSWSPSLQGTELLDEPSLLDGESFPSFEHFRDDIARITDLAARSLLDDEGFPSFSQFADDIHRIFDHSLPDHESETNLSFSSLPSLEGTNLDSLSLPPEDTDNHMPTLDGSHFDDSLSDDDISGFPSFDDFAPVIRQIAARWTD
ncbi:hypothetical protein H2203_002673 [Taxawa tesnikishii (nom. ined.)]|nr:hypothetical protein H2203_002673 [Dothideales sp. JES 119]